MNNNEIDPEKPMSFVDGVRILLQQDTEYTHNIYLSKRWNEIHDIEKSDAANNNSTNSSSNNYNNQRADGEASTWTAEAGKPQALPRVKDDTCSLFPIFILYLYDISLFFYTNLTPPPFFIYILLL